MIKCQQTLIVGLGPTGRRFLEQLKLRISQKYGELPAFKLMAIDVPLPETAVLGGAAGAVEESILDPSEVQELPLEEVVGSPEQQRSQFSWLSKRLIGLKEEWVQTRAAARLALSYHLSTIIGRLEWQMTQIGTIETREAMAEKGFDIANDLNQAGLIIVGHLGEVSGSGLLLDATALCHYLFRRNGLQPVSRAILFMPGTDSYASALAYATLKELNQAVRQQYYKAGFRNYQAEINGLPFNSGCYLVGLTNERILNLKSQEDQIALAAAWAFHNLTTPLISRVDDFAGQSAPNARSQDQSAVYASLGFSANILPVEDLIDWSAYTLGTELIQGNILSSQMFAQVAQRLTDFYNKSHLQADSLMQQELGLDARGGSIQKDPDVRNRINSLQTVALGDTIQTFRAVFKRITEDILPKLRSQINNNADKFLNKARGEIVSEISAILRLTDQGGVSLARQFARRLQADFEDYAEALNRREAALDAILANRNERMKQLYSTLEKTMAAVPPIWMIALGVLAGLVAPLVLTSFWLLNGANNSGLIPTICVWVGSLSAGGYAWWKINDQVQQVRNAYIAELSQSFETAIGLTLVREARRLYPEIKVTIDLQLAKLDAFTEQLQQLARNFKKRQDPAPFCDEYGFSLQRSVLKPELVENLYNRFLGVHGAEAHLTGLWEHLGRVDTWLNQDSDELEAGFLGFGRKAFQGMKDLRVEEVMLQQLDTPTKVERAANDLLIRSAPLITIDLGAIGQQYAPQMKVFIGLHTTDETSTLGPVFTRLNPTAEQVAIEDRYTMVVTSIRQGVPLFGLRRLEELRNNYVDEIRRGDIPLHTDDRGALAPDLIPASPAQGVHMDSAQALALGLALSLVKTTRPDSPYGFMPKGKEAILLDKDKIDSAILLSCEPEGLKALSEEINARVEEQTASKVAEQLEKYLQTRQDLDDWEREGIKRYINVLRG